MMTAIDHAREWLRHMRWVSGTRDSRMPVGGLTNYEEAASPPGDGLFDVLTRSARPNHRTGVPFLRRSLACVLQV